MPFQSQQGWSQSTTVPLGLKAGTSTLTPPALAAQATGESTFAMSGVSTGDLLITVDPRAAVSSAYSIVGAWISGANEGTIRFANIAGSTVSHSTGITVRWAFIDITA